MVDYFQIGVITNTHGIRGELKVIPTTEDPKRFEALEKVWVVRERETQVYHIEAVRYFKQFVLLKFKGVKSINEVEHLKKASIQIPREWALPLEEDEYYIRDLLGLKVITEDEQLLGIIKDVIMTGSNEVYVVETDEKKEILLPAIKECILKVDIEEKIMQVHLMKGLMDQ